MKIVLPSAVQMLLDMLAASGYEAYVVGGCVRDSLLGMEPKDWDLSTDARPEEILAVFSGLPTLETGIKHGTTGVITSGINYEITTYRSDGTYSDKRHPDSVSYVRDLKEDLSRRDFTINAMAYNEKNGLVDYFNGQEDLQKKRIRCVGNAAMRFEEDALRILRALRFASSYGFLIEPDTEAALREKKELLIHVSAERIREEFNQLLLGDNAEAVLTNYADVISVFVPEISCTIGYDQHNPYHVYDVWQHTVKAIASAEKNSIVRLALFLHDLQKPFCASKDQGHFYGHGSLGAEKAQIVLNRLRYDKRTIQRVTRLILYHDMMLRPEKKFIKRWLNKLGEEELRMLLQLKRADAKAQNPQFLQERLLKLDAIEEVLEKIIKDEECFSLKDLAVTGRDLLQSGYEEGKKIGETLDVLLEMVIEEKVQNEKEYLLKEVKKIYEKENEKR